MEHQIKRAKIISRHALNIKFLTSSQQTKYEKSNNRNLKGVIFSSLSAFNCHVHQTATKTAQNQIVSLQSIRRGDLELSTETYLQIQLHPAECVVLQLSKIYHGKLELVRGFHTSI